MFIDRPGKICDGLYMLGWKQSLMYLAQGAKSMIIGGAMSWIAPRLEQQFKEYEIDTGSIEYLVIPHSHFDHFGAVPYLKRRFPQIKVCWGQKLLSGYFQRKRSSITRRW